MEAHISFRLLAVFQTTQRGTTTMAHHFIAHKPPRSRSESRPADTASILAHPAAMETHWGGAQHGEKTHFRLEVALQDKYYVVSCRIRQHRESTPCVPHPAFFFSPQLITEPTTSDAHCYAMSLPIPREGVIGVNYTTQALLREVIYLPRHV